MENVKTTIEKKFDALWMRLVRYPNPSEMELSEFEAWAAQMGIAVDALERKNIGVFHSTTSICLVSGEYRACFPLAKQGEDEAWLRNRERANQEAALWEKMEWFAPLWITGETTGKLRAAVRFRGKEESLRLFEYHMSTEYTLAFQAVCIAQLLPKTRTLSDFAPIVREAYLAFFSGYRASSIAALIPIFEGAINRMTEATTGSQVHHEIDRVFDRAFAFVASMHFEGMWAPADCLTVEYLFGQDERVYFLETYRRWLKTSFFQDTTKYDGAMWLNRHLFAHGLSPQWQQSANFQRLVIALATLGVVESWHDKSNVVSIFFPEMNEDSTLLWQQALLRGSVQMTLKKGELEEYHRKGRLVPNMPTDNGVTLRMAHLMQACMDELVKPMRNAGWSIKVGEAEDTALFVTVMATSGEEIYNVALLYSCATDNSIYRDLAGQVNAILYMGAPYMQESFAYGIDIHVGPVLAWQPPIASYKLKGGGNPLNGVRRFRKIGKAISSAVLSLLESKPRR